MNGRIRVGIDIGGTFTDLVAYNEATGDFLYSKVPSTPKSPEIGFSNSISEVHIEPRDMVYVAHGTTLVTNAIIQDMGAKIGLVTTRGFRDVLEIRRQRREYSYSLSMDQPQPVVPRYLRKEVDERIDAYGDIVRPLQFGEVQSILGEFADLGVQGVAVCLLNSYVNPVHEKQIQDIAANSFPQLPVSASFEIDPEMGEYERTSTTAYNAYVQPLVREYVQKLSSKLQAPLYLVQSDGGTITVDELIKKPVVLARSGPAAGNFASLFYSKLLGIDNLMTFDMGGTSCEASLIRFGEFVKQDKVEPRFQSIIRTPSIYYVLIGTGGGSIVHVDEAGGFKVGPQSAGAEPGPACYGMGGTNATVTDANLVLNLLNPAYFLGGKLRLDTELAFKAFKPIADHFGSSVQDVASGTREVVNASMTQALRELTIRQGIDPRDFTILSYGGASGLHIAVLARELRIGKVIVPLWPSNHSALGAIVSPITISSKKTIWKRLDQISPMQLEAAFSELEEKSARVLGEANSLQMVRRADLRYEGQWFEIPVPIPNELTDASIKEAEREFHDRHFKVYGVKHDAPIELMFIRSSVIKPIELPVLKKRQPRTEGRPAPKMEREILLDKRKETVPVYERGKLQSEDRIDGCCIIEEPTSTILVPYGAVAEIDEYGNIVMTVGV